MLAVAPWLVAAYRSPSEVALAAGRWIHGRTLPRDLQPWGMFLSADIVVKAVMIGLAFASLVTWTVWLAKTIELMLARRRARAALCALDDAHAAQAQARSADCTEPGRRLWCGRGH